MEETGLPDKNRLLPKTLVTFLQNKANEVRFVCCDRVLVLSFSINHNVQLILSVVNTNRECAKYFERNFNYSVFSSGPRTCAQIKFHLDKMVCVFSSPEQLLELIARLKLAFVVEIKCSESQVNI